MLWVLSHIPAKRRKSRPGLHRERTTGSVVFTPFRLHGSISDFGGFWFVSFCCHKTVIIIFLKKWPKEICERIVTLQSLRGKWALTVTTHGGNLSCPLSFLSCFRSHHHPTWGYATRNLGPLSVKESRWEGRKWYCSILKDYLSLFWPRAKWQPFKNLAFQLYNWLNAESLRSEFSLLFFLFCFFFAFFLYLSVMSKQNKSLLGGSMDKSHTI